MRTQAKVLEIFKKNRYTVISFNSETGRRESTYGRCEIITAMGEVILKTSQGLKVLIFDGKDENLKFPSEFVLGRRINYDEVKHLALKNLYSQEVSL